MLSYAGIGSRNISDAELKLISLISQKLSRYFVLYSGNAEGSDITFQSNCNNNCVIMLPWLSFNKTQYDINNSKAYFDVGNTPEGNASVDEFHPYPENLSQGARRMMARNYHQVSGYDIYPQVSFVVCCADPLPGGDVKGGTGQAVRIALYKQIPVVNIRKDRWQEFLTMEARKAVGKYGPGQKIRTGS